MKTRGLSRETPGIILWHTDWVNIGVNFLDRAELPPPSLRYTPPALIDRAVQLFLWPSLDLDRPNPRKFNCINTTTQPC